MSEDFEDFVEGLQNQIFEETRSAYGDVAFLQEERALLKAGKLYRRM